MVFRKCLSQYVECARTRLKYFHAIGVLLCTDTDSTIARYSVLHENEQLFAAKYMTYMPSEEELRREIEQQSNFLWSNKKLSNSKVFNFNNV